MAGTSLIRGGVRGLVSLVFLVSGGLKLQDPSRFLLDVQSFELLPYTLAYAVALALPWLEVFGAVALWRQSLARSAALLLGLATLGFIAALGLATAKGIALDCGCFGDWLVFPNLGAHVAFNLALAGMCFALLRTPTADPGDSAESGHARK